MKRNVIVALVFACAFGVVSSVRAQQTAAKDVEGSVTSVEPTYMWVKPDSGESVMVMIDAKTTITKDKKISTKDVKAGDHATAHGPENQGMIMATAIEVGAPAKNTKK